MFHVLCNARLHLSCECVYVCVASDPLLAAAQHQESFNVVFLQVGIPLSSKSRFHFIVLIKVLQRGFGDVDSPACVTQTARKDVVYL